MKADCCNHNRRNKLVFLFEYLSNKWYLNWRPQTSIWEYIWINIMTNSIEKIRKYEDEWCWATSIFLLSCHTYTHTNTIYEVYFPPNWQKRPTRSNSNSLGCIIYVVVYYSGNLEKNLFCGVCMWVFVVIDGLGRDRTNMSTYIMVNLNISNINLFVCHWLFPYKIVLNLFSIVHVWAYR